MARTRVREFAYEVLDGERDYQDAMAGNSARETIDTNRELPSLIVLMAAYQAKLAGAWALPSPDNRQESLHVIRKITALGVLAMERHGSLPR